jgi:hypothetical protein
MLDRLKRLFAGAKPPVPPAPPGRPPLATLDDLDALIDRCGLSAARDLIQAYTTPCFHLIAGGPAADAPLGTTRLGGAPDLPVGSVWPAGKSGYCGFLGQLDLADVAAHTGAAGLPNRGLLSLFVDSIDSAAEPVPVRAILTPSGAALTRLAAPPGRDDYGACANPLNPVQISAFVPGINVPPFDPRLYDQIEALAPDADVDAFQDALWPTPPGTIGQLLGQGFDHDGTDLRLAIQARQIGRPGLERYDFIADWTEWEELKQIEQRLQNGTLYRPWTDANDDDVRYVLDHRPALAAGAADLRLLILIRSNKAMNLWINDADPIFLFIPSARLKRGDFSELHGAVTQG